jgi:hypothetical protein
MPISMQAISPIPVFPAFSKHALHHNKNSPYITIPSLRPSKKFLKLIRNSKRHRYSKQFLQEKAFNVMDKIEMQQNEKEWYDEFKRRVLEHEYDIFNMTEIQTLIDSEDDFIEVTCNIDGLGEICYYTSVC